MPAVIIVDTSIFTNVLNIPGFNQNRANVMQQLEEYLANEDINLLLPMAAIFETGNHIAQIGDGNQRRRFGELFVEQVRAALEGEAPWRPTQLPDNEKISEWLNEFPDNAMRGLGIGDLSIIKEWEAASDRHPGYRVLIWSLDAHLNAYDRMP